jgi:hypothetical protein
MKRFAATWSRLALRCSGVFLTTDFTDIKDLTDGEKLPARKIFQGKQEADRCYYTRAN